jgi:hypothetical protein
MTDDKKPTKQPTPQDAQKGGQGSVAKDDPQEELNQKGHPGEDRRKNR